ncbi:unnamed protein product [Nezara viridula]|uniref:Uncharacterized protein n=1 Tax=Nezara viridula TaxID=85310 RepID=A0A9P0E928_NEZVI|nr:unnamed protein product [Nezara viridula]
MAAEDPPEQECGALLSMAFFSSGPPFGQHTHQGTSRMITRRLQFAATIKTRFLDDNLRMADCYVRAISQIKQALAKARRLPSRLSLTGDQFL